MLCSPTKRSSIKIDLTISDTTKLIKGWISAFFSQQEYGDVSGIVRGCFSWREVGLLAEFTVTLNHEKYIDILERCDEKVLFNVGIGLLDWLSVSPDLNLKENLWGTLFHDIDACSKQYENVKDLKQATWDSWRKVGKEYCKSLIKSMPRSCIEVFGKLGPPSTM
eukprot:IDg4247t1